MRRIATLSTLVATLAVSLVAALVPSASATSRPPAPALIEAEDKGSYVSVKWRHYPYTKVEVYRDSGSGMRYVTTVTNGNVFNDFGAGDAGDVYQVLGHDRDGRLSNRSAERRATGYDNLARGMWIIDVVNGKPTFVPGVDKDDPPANDPNYNGDVVPIRPDPPASISSGGQTSTQDERNEAGHNDPGSDAGTDELSGYAG